MHVHNAASSVRPVLVQYGMGNVGSILNMFNRLGVKVTPSGDPKTILEASHLIFPGVGSFDECSRNVAPLVSVLDEFKRSGKPLLGVCVGMQLLFEGSEEGERPGLGWIKGMVRKFQSGPGSLPVPHMSWQSLQVARDSSLFRSSDSQEMRFYFVHSYHGCPEDELVVTARSDYGGPFVAAVETGNVLGVQFHPEKSHAHGLSLFRRFLEVPPLR